MTDRTDLDRMLVALTSAEDKGYLTLAHDRTGLRSDKDTRTFVAQYLLTAIGADPDA